MGSRLLSGRYELLEKIGDGGMAVVYKGKDRLLNRFIAIKILRPEFTKDATFVENFKRESQAAAGLTHPNIVGVYDVGREGNINYIVMELIEGRTLNDIIEDEAPMDYKKVIDISKQVASALKIAHKNKIIHRDVKPHNIMITNDGIVKLADFGIARAVNDATLSTGSKIVGSVHYFSPEQARGNYVDERSDIYSLGIVMYEMLTGKVPFDGENPVTVALKHINEEITPPSELVSGIPPALERCVMKATNKYQTNRFSSAEEMIEELDNISFVTDVAGTSIFESSDVVERRNKRKAQLAAQQEEEENGGKGKGRGNDGNNEGRGKRRLIIALIVLLLALIGGLVVAWKMGVFSSTKPAPDFIDKTIDEAMQIAEEEGFVLKQGKDVYSSDIAEGRICIQDPESSVETPKGGTITVHLSKGSKEGMVPNVVGLSQDEAIRKLEEYGYKKGNINIVTDPAPEGTVLTQTPEAGTTLDKESRVNLEVSDGKGVEQALVPAVIGMSLKKAKAAIREAGFEVGKVDYDWSNSVDKGYVMYQSYPSGYMLDKGTRIDIQVSKGSEPKPEKPEPADDDSGDSGNSGGGSGDSGNSGGNSGDSGNSGGSGDSGDSGNSGGESGDGGDAAEDGDGN